MADQQPAVNFNVNPEKSPVLFVDAYVIGSSQHAITLNFAQAVVDSQQQHIVSRVALTMHQAKSFLADLSDHIEKFER